MPLREIPADRSADAEIMASILDLVPVRYGDSIRLMSRNQVMDRIEELRQAGEEGGPRLLTDLEFDGEAVFRMNFSRMASRTATVRTSTLFRVLEVMASSGESRNELLRRLLAPAVEEVLQEIEGRADEEKVRMLRFSLEGWTGLRRTVEDDIDPPEVAAVRGTAGPRPVLRTRTDPERLPPELKKYSRYFLKNLFRLNNIYGRNEFFHPPEAIENYWEIISADQGIFDVEMAPASKSLTVGLYRTSRRFGLERSDNPDYYQLVEMLAAEGRSPRIKGCRVELHGASEEDEIALQEALSVEAVLFDEHALVPAAVGLPQPLSEGGLELFRARLRSLSGIRAEVRFPINVEDPEGGDQDFAVLGFDLALDKDTGRFLLDGAVVAEPSMDQLVLAVGGKLFGLSNQLYREPGRFPRPEVDDLDAEVHALIAKAEREGLTEELARDIVAKITVLDYYESLAKYSYALSEQVCRYLEGTQEITFTMPRVLLALLDGAIEERGLDRIILAGLPEDGGA